MESKKINELKSILKSNLDSAVTTILSYNWVSETCEASMDVHAGLTYSTWLRYDEFAELFNSIKIFELQIVGTNLEFVNKYVPQLKQKEII